METTHLSFAIPLSIQLTFEQIQVIVLQLPSAYKHTLIASLLKEETETYYNPYLKGSLNPKQFVAEQNNTEVWQHIEGAWKGVETDEEVRKSLTDLS